ncbi:MAG: nucleotide exchange factor GrpE [Candidatus Gastranaerophilales bacterium]|nr:nucleotide exchange factor GrpE [Candidatus Gastranaerophilales bacterium]
MSNNEEIKQENPFAQELPKEDNVNQEENIQETQETAEENAEKSDDKTNEEFENLKNQYVRLAADFDNYRKRQAQERESLLKYGAESTLKLILPVLDTYNRGKKACEDMEDSQQLKENFEVIFKQLFDALDKAGLKKIETIGKEFDPNLHEAVMQTPTSDYPDNSIIDEMQAGYMLCDRVLRPSMVNVAVSE